MITIHDLKSVRTQVAGWKHEGRVIGLVPTMGNLHKGHISLVEKAKQHADRVVASIFVNPIQFGKGEDYERYPSTLEDDKQKLAAIGLDLLFAPDLAQLYPGGTDVDTRVSVPELSNILCGTHRPDHFSGVATVVSKLFINIQPDVALFGEKDYQQLLIIKRMAHDMCMPITIMGVSIMREEDGLAMSSRNAYLTPEERRKAPIIYRSLQQAAALLQSEHPDIESIESQAQEQLRQAGLHPEYFSIRNAEDLGEPQLADSEVVILVAAWLGKARLIDNLCLTLLK